MNGDLLSNIKLKKKKFFDSTEMLHMLQQLIERSMSFSRLQIIHGAIHPSNILVTFPFDKTSGNFDHDFVNSNLVLINYETSIDLSAFTENDEYLPKPHLLTMEISRCVAPELKFYIKHPDHIINMSLFSEKIDIFGVGCVIYWMTVGSPPTMMANNYQTNLQRDRVCDSFVCWLI